MSIVMFTSPVTNIVAQAMELNTSKMLYDGEVSEKKEDVPGNIIAEVKENRKEYSKEFKLDNGRFIVAQYEYPVHYLDDEGNWVDYDNTLTPVACKEVAGEETATITEPSTMTATAPLTEAPTKASVGSQAKTANDVLLPTETTEKPTDSQNNENTTVLEESQSQLLAGRLTETLPQLAAKEEYNNKNSDIDIRLSKKAKKYNMIKIDKNGYQISMGYADVNQSKKIEIVKDTTKLEGNDKFLARKKAVSEVLYSDAFNNIDLQYFITPIGLKENIILKNKDAQTSFIINYNSKGLTPTQINNSTIELKDKLGNVVYSIAAPFMVDSKGEISEALTLSLTCQSKNKFAIELKLDEDWLNDWSRSYPVTVDPIVGDHTNSTDLQTGYISSSTPNSVSPSSPSTLKVDKANTIIAKMVNLPKLPTGSTITKMNYHLVSVGGCNGLISVRGYTNKSVDLATTTWNNKPTGELVDYTKSVTNTNVKVDLTSLAYQWYYENKNYGFGIERIGDTTGTDQFYYYSPVSPWINPTFTLEYLYKTGMTDYGNNEQNEHGFQQSIGRAGNAAVNAYSGALNIKTKDIGVGGNVMPVEISRIYDPSFTTEMGFGPGWMTNYNQRIYKEIAGQNTYYHFIDEEGTYHTFFDKTPSATTILDENECCELTVDSSRTIGNFTLETGDLVKTFNTEGFLTSIKDTSQPAQPTILITYFFGGRINKITDGAGRVYKFKYGYDGKKYFVTDIDYIGKGSTSLQNISYQYTNYNLTSVTYADGEKCSYTYSGNNITNIGEVSGYNISYSYTGGRITKISEYAGTTAGDYINISYAKGKTVATDAQGQTLTINFDYYGNKVSTVNEVGNITYYETGYEGKGLLGSSKEMQPARNYFKNPSFEEPNGSTNFTITKNAGNIKVDYASYFAYTGSYSLSVSSTMTSNYEICQTISTNQQEENTSMTFSAWVKTEGTGVKAAITLLDVNAGTKVHSDQTSTNGKWQRIQVTIPSTANRNYKCYLSYEGIGKAYFDDIQLNPNDEPMELSYIIDGDMPANSTKWTYQNGNADSLFGGVNQEAFVKQRVYINGLQGDTFTVSGIASAGSASTYNKDALEDQPFFGIRVIAPDVSESLAEVDFSGTYNTPYYAGGQSCDLQATEFILPVDCAYVDVYFRYDYNINDAYIGNISLFKDKLFHYTFGQYGNEELSSVEDSNDNYDPSPGENNDDSEDLNEYDTYNRVTKEVEENGFTTSYTYDKYGNVLTRTQTDGTTSITNKNTYTTDGNYQTTAKDEFGNGYTNTYDSNLGVITNQKDHLGSNTQYSFDSMNRPIDMQVSNSGTNQKISTQYSYNHDQQISVTHNGFTYKVNKNEWGDPTDIKVGSQTLANYSYTDNVTRLLNKVTFGNNQEIQKEYTENKNNQKLLSGVKFTGDTKNRFTYEYGNTGNLLQLIDNKSARKTVYEPDGIKKIYSTSVSLPGLIYSVAKKSYDVNTSYRYETAFGKNTMFQLTNNPTDNKTTYSYDHSGNNVKVVTNKDKFDRINNQVVTNKASNNVVKSEYIYQSTGTNQTSNRVEKAIISFGTSAPREYAYTYDAAGNITQIKEKNVVKMEYTYDQLGQLIQENNYNTGQTVKYEYDNGGNLKLEKVYYLNSTTMMGTRNFTYGDSNWKDKLTAYDGKSITYDAIGNPITYDKATYTWEGGRQLKRFSKSGTVADYSYDENGLRTSKTINGITTRSIYDEGKLVALQAKKPLYFRYDQNDQPVSVNYDGEEYFYVKNLQGDIIRIVDKNGVDQVLYTYDSWGKVLNITGTLASTLGADNPLRYRGYVYDTETGLYYLQSRYYSPDWKRFINADSLMDTGTSPIGTNMFAYCENNPIMKVDFDGQFAGALAVVAIAAITIFFVVAVAVVILSPGFQQGWSGFCKWAGNGLSNAFSQLWRGINSIWSWGTRQMLDFSRAIRIVRAIERSDTKIKTTVRRGSSVRYWAASLSSSHVLILGRPISKHEAIKRVSRRKSVFTVTRGEAKDIASRGSRTGKAIKNPEIHLKQGISLWFWNLGVFYHYHTSDRNGAHIWYLY